MPQLELDKQARRMQETAVLANWGVGQPTGAAVLARDDRIAKFWIDPVRLQSSGGFNRSELAQIGAVIMEHRTELMEAWDEYFGN